MKLAVIGPGLIGRSVTLATRRHQPDAELVELDRGADLEKAVGVDLIVLAAPVDQIVHLIVSHGDLFRSTVTIDTGSVKRRILQAARDANLAMFVGGHPMAGSAHSGPQNAREDLFDERPWFLFSNGISSETLARASSFVTSLGARPVILDDDGSEHDRVMAAVSHLPQIVASTLMQVVAQAAGDRLVWAGSGLRDTTRLAESPASLWQSILASNQSALRPLLLDMADALRDLADHLDDRDAVSRLFDAANQARRRRWPQ